MKYLKVSVDVKMLNKNLHNWTRLFHYFHSNQMNGKVKPEVKKILSISEEFSRNKFKLDFTTWKFI